jgi:hypothetical protein
MKLFPKPLPCAKLPHTRLTPSEIRITLGFLDILARYQNPHWDNQDSQIESH